MNVPHLAHLSDECNTPALALSTMRQVLRAAGREDVRVEVLSHTQVSARRVVWHHEHASA